MGRDTVRRLSALEASISKADAPSGYVWCFHDETQEAALSRQNADWVRSGSPALDVGSVAFIRCRQWVQPEHRA